MVLLQRLLRGEAAERTVSLAHARFAWLSAVEGEERT